MKDEIKQYSQCSSEEEILLPMCNIFPANQIITKIYEPDQTPAIKYIPKQILKQKQTLKHSYSFDQLKISNPEFQQYAEIFGTQDFLGKYYSDQLNQMIYFKFNNKDYNQLKINEKKYRFFAGFFVEKQHFEEILSEKYDNIMKSFPFLDFNDYNSNLLLSFANNNKGSFQDPKFSSNYDSANLFAVIKKKNHEYDLILQNDMNSKGNNQWFNFLVNFPEQGTYKFNIVNFTKSHSLYEQGMKIACYSFTKQMHRGNPENHKNGSGWFRSGKNIKYFKNNIQRQAQGSNNSYYSLSFEYSCKQLSESVVFSYTIPYSGLELQKYFNKLLHKRLIGHFKMQKIHVCDSIAGKPIHGYIISHRKSKLDSFISKGSLTQSCSTDKLQSPKYFNFSKNFQKRSLSPSLNEESTQLKSVILMARQHPGQVQSSFILQGMVDFLMANSELDLLKKAHTFFVFPMVNVDGVKYGHYRTNLCGIDLNRVWRLPRKQTHPEVYHLKKLLYEINRTIPISLILDIHGHSKALNSFFYGNPSKKENLSFDDPKVFPFICSKRMKQISYKQCTFNIREQKKNSARVVLSEMFPKALVYTMENSFYGYVNKKSKDEAKYNQQEDIIEYTPEGYRKVGKQLISTYLEYTKLSEKNNSIKAKWVKEMQEIYSEMQKSKSSDANNQNQDGGSDSQLQNELIDMDQNINNALKTQNQQGSLSPRKLWKPRTSPLSKTSFISRKSQKKKTMPLPKTICQQNVRGIPSHISRSFTTLKDLNSKSQDMRPFENKENLEGKNPLDIAKKPEYPQAVLSIFKIQTQRSSLLKKKTSINYLLGFQQNSMTTQIIQKARVSPPNNLLNRSPNKFEKQSFKTTIIQKKSRQSFQPNQNLNVQDVINKCAGMKTFLKTKGITIQNRKA